ncbi:BRO family protein [Aggregatibacter actinomycetemcomitans]|uniref:BRO family protein n=1 Tax=Aggregatibacter actinomycetemcomitans TaxID=714 RepID=UPI001E5CC8FF|nr:BRO family protein [Aggregatibacter actinomycetemcomitans]
MSNLQIFNFNSNPVRIELFDNQPHFCLLDVCEIFEIQNSRRVQSQMLDPQGVRLAYILAKDEKQRRTAFINEPNLYRIIFRSEKPIAKNFQNWVFEEVLPQIRKTGKYQLQAEPALPEPEKTYTVTLTEYELQTVAWACFAFRRNNNLLHELYSPLAAIGSKFAVEARDNAVEYRNTLRRFNEVVKRITVDIEADPETNWRVLKHIRSFNEKIFGKVETTI